MSTSESVTLCFKLRVGDSELDVESRVPAGDVALPELLPAIAPIASAIVEAAVAPIVEAGASVSCGPGCGACCRQPVPIAESEAVRLVGLVEAMPASRRRAIQRRFDVAVARLADAGLLEGLESLNAIDDIEARQQLGRAYFDLQIPCPFLEDESCGIHQDRPLACREYLVTSPAADCASPDAERIEMIPIPLRPSVALFRIGESDDSREARSVVLTLARRFLADSSRGQLPSGKGPRLLERWVRELAGGS